MVLPHICIIDSVRRVFFLGKNTCPSFMRRNRIISNCVATIGCHVFFGCTAPAVHPFLLLEGAVDLNYFKDKLFDVINESDELDVADIQTDDAKDLFLIVMKDGSVFALRAMKVN